MAEPDSTELVAEAVPLVGNRRFWVYRSDLDAGAVNAAFDRLDAEFDPAGDDPVGLAVYVGDPELIRARPEAVWEDTGLAYAGTTREGTHLRIRYFADARITPGLPNSPAQADWSEDEHSLSPGYTVVPLAESDAVGPDDVLELWERERAVPRNEAARRVHEVAMVGLDPNNRLVAVSTVYLQRNQQLGMDLWYYRTFVAGDHRLGNISILLARETRERLRRRYEGGEDTRGAGVIMEVENDFLKAYYNTGYWVTRYWFIGENERGDHVRVHYFPGAAAPSPAGQGA